MAHRQKKRRTFFTWFVSVETLAVVSCVALMSSKRISDFFVLVYHSNCLGLQCEHTRGRDICQFQKGDLKFDDIGVVEDIPEEPVTEVKFTDVSVMGVKNLEIFEGCYSCSRKVIPQSDTLVGKCPRCATVQHIE